MTSCLFNTTNGFSFGRTESGFHCKIITVIGIEVAIHCNTLKNYGGWGVEVVKETSVMYTDVPTLSTDLTMKSTPTKLPSEFHITIRLFRGSNHCELFWASNFV